MVDFILEAQNVHYTYPGHTVGLAGLSLAVAPGKRIALLGANGAGKTTVLLHLNGTLRPQSGEIRLHGTSIAYSRNGLRQLRQHVGLVFQNPEEQLFAGTVYQDVSFGPLNLGLPEIDVRRRVDEALAALDITDLADRPTHMLSFGQKKRAAIAGAIAMHPCVLILDEPTAGLDPEGARQLLDVLARLQQRGTTLVLATHDMDLAYAWADDVAVLAAGRLLAYGPPDTVLQADAVLRASRLIMPLVLELALHFRAQGYLPPDRVLPRTREALLEQLQPQQTSTGITGIDSPRMATYNAKT